MVIVVLMLLGVLAAAGLIGFVYVKEKTLPPQRESDVIIVLGAQVKPDGSPSEALRRRLTAALETYREKALKNQRDLTEKWQESRKKGIDSRNRTAMRHKIKDVVNELNQYLLRGTKDRHVPIDLQKAVAEALDAVNMDTVGADERIAKLEAELLTGKARYRAASLQKNQSADMFVDMCWYLMEYYEENGESEKGKRQLILASQVLEVLQEDPASQYLTEMEQKWRAEMMERIKEKLLVMQ